MRKTSRVEEVVVDAPVDDVDALQPRVVRMKTRSSLHDEIAALDDLDAHLAGEEASARSRRSCNARREQHDASARLTARVGAT